MDTVGFTYIFLMVIIVIRGQEETPNIAENINFTITFELYLTKVITTTPNPTTITTEGMTTKTTEGTKTTKTERTTITTEGTTTTTEGITATTEGMTNITTVGISTTTTEVMTTPTTKTTSTTEGTTTTTEGTTTTDGMTTTTTEGITSNTEIDTTSNITSEVITTLDTKTTWTTTVLTSPSLPPDVIKEVKAWLISVFNDTVGFVSLEVKNLTEIRTLNRNDLVPVQYDVIFSVLTLSEFEALCTDGDSCLTQELTTKTKTIIGHQDGFSGYYVDSDLTNSSMVEATNDFSDNYLVDPCSKLQSGVCSNINNTCYTENGAIVCRDKCFVYERDVNPECTNPSSSLSTIFISGSCTIKDGDVECNCGMSPGDVMPNFYDGTRCISSAFIVGMAAGIGGFIIIVLLGVAIGIGLKSKQNIEKHKDFIKAYDQVTMERASHELSRDFPNDKEQFDYTNTAFDSRYEALSSCREEFSNFHPALSHIDPQADYTFPRPCITITEATLSSTVPVHLVDVCMFSTCFVRLHRAIKIQSQRENLSYWCVFIRISYVKFYL